MSILDKIERRLKASEHIPELAYIEHVTNYVANDSGSDTDVGGESGFKAYAETHRAHTWVRKAVDVVSKNIAALEVEVVDKDGESIDNHPVTFLFSNANDSHSQSDIWEAHAVNMLLTGESFYELALGGNGVPVEMWARSPDKMVVVKDDSKERVLYPRVAGYKILDFDDLIPPELVWHDKLHNPLNPWRGLSPIAAVRASLVIDMFAQAWSRSFLKSGARPDYALIAPEGLTQTERDNLETALYTKFQGQGNWHKPIILEEGVTDVKQLSFPPKDIEWLEQRRVARDEVAAIFGVPDEVMGFGKDTYENMDAAFRWLWLLTLVPFTQRRDRSLTHFFTKVHPMLQPGERVLTNLSGVGALSEDISPKLDQAAKLWEMGVPFNLIDERLDLGVGVIEYGDIGFLNMGKVPIELRVNPPARPEPPVPSEDSEDDANDEEPADDAEDEDENDVADAQEDEDVKGAMRALVRSKGIKFGSTQHKLAWDEFVDQLAGHEDPFIRELKRQFQRQQNDVLRRIREYYGEKAPPELPSVDDLFNYNFEAKLMAEAFGIFYERALLDFGQGAIDDLRLGLDFDLSDPLVASEARTMPIQFANDINRTTQSAMADIIRDIAQEKVDLGLSITDVQKLVYERISKRFNIRKSDYETERIARTEMNKAANRGSLEGWRQSKVVTRKGWLGALDDRIRDDHLLAHDQYDANPIPLDDDFEVGGGSGPCPGSIGLAEQDINCRCTMVAYVD